MPTHPRPKKRPARKPRKVKRKRSHKSSGIRLDALHALTIVHALGKEPGRALCGAALPGALASPLANAWGALAERKPAVEALASAFCTRSDEPGSLPCPGCATNLRRMREADERQLELLR